MRQRILAMTMDEAMKCFDVYFDGIESPDDYYVEFARWVEEKMNDVDSFVEYVLSFYGVGEIYDMGATREEVLKAVDVRLTCELYKLMPFDGDSIDREAVRDIMLATRQELAA